MKRIHLFLAMLMIPLLGMSQNLQDDFNKRWQAYITQESQKPISDELAHDLHHAEEDLGHALSEERKQAFVETHFKYQFLEENYSEYLRIFNPPSQQRENCNDVCCNGGFESGFDCYEGWNATYNQGTTMCDYNGVFSMSGLPSVNEYEIVGTGTDTWIPALQTTRFGNSAARINSPDGHINNSTCAGDLGINRLRKNFVVTEENRNFTLWYAFVLEDPNGHQTTKPFFSVALSYGGTTVMPVCFNSNDPFLLPDVQQCNTDAQLFWRDWSCVNLSIPDSMVGQLATLDITTADCGLSAHAGWAYVDGICESCDSSADGSITLLPPDSCSTKICGSYTLPTGGSGSWSLSSININNAAGTNLTIDAVNQTFCFELEQSDFTTDCITITADAVFTNGSQSSTSFSNAIDVCEDDVFCDQGCLQAVVIETICDNQGTTDPSDDTWEVIIEVNDPSGNGTFWRSTPHIAAGSYGSQKHLYMGSLHIPSPYVLFIYDDDNPECNTTLLIDVPPPCSDTCALEIKYEVSKCFDNDTPDFISDDYYYVDLMITGTNGLPWMVKQKPENGGPDVLLEQGTGDQSLTLGPFLIQDGDWTMWVFYSEYYDCIVDVYIKAPKFCSGCHEVEIANIQCINNGTADPSDDQWTFDIYIDGPGDYWTTSAPVGQSGPYGQWKTIWMGPISNYGSTISFVIYDNKDEKCFTEVEIAVPKPCSEECKLETRIEVSECKYDDESGEFVYYVTLDVSGTNGQCWMAKKKNSDGSDELLGSYNGDGTVVLGPFVPGEDWTLWVFICDQFDCVLDYFINAPECDKEGGERFKFEGAANVIASEQMSVFPNPTSGDVVNISSSIKLEEVKVVNMQNTQVRRLIPNSSVISLDVQNLKPGVYYIIGKDINGDYHKNIFIKH